MRERNLQRDTRLKIPSISGRGEAIFFVFALRARKSTTTRNFNESVLTLGIKSIGAVLLALVICQRPVFRYVRRFSSHRCLRASGQRDGRHGSIFSSSISGIV